MNPRAPASGEELAVPLSKAERRRFRCHTRSDEEEYLRKPLERHWEKPRWKKRNSKLAKEKHKEKEKERQKRKKVRQKEAKRQEDSTAQRHSLHQAAGAASQFSASASMSGGQGSASSGGDGGAPGSPKKFCWRFQKDGCKLGAERPFFHEQKELRGATSKAVAAPKKTLLRSGDLCPLTSSTAETPQREKLDLTVDSGVAVSALPRAAVASYPTKAVPEKNYTAASGHPVPTLGQRTPVLQFQNKTIGAVDFEVMDVSKPLLSVSRMVARGHRVVFDAESNGGSYIQNTHSGKRLRIYERNGVYVVPSWVRPFSGPSQP